MIASTSWEVEASQEIHIKKEESFLYLKFFLAFFTVSERYE